MGDGYTQQKDNEEKQNGSLHKYIDWRRYHGWEWGKSCTSNKSNYNHNHRRRWCIGILD